jgi:hypothetical protein
VFSKSAVGIGPAHTHPAQVNSDNMERRPPPKEVVFSLNHMRMINGESSLLFGKFSDSQPCYSDLVLATHGIYYTTQLANGKLTELNFDQEGIRPFFACRKQGQIMTKTETQFREVMQKCRSLFISKSIDYGTSWRIMRLPSVTDQIFIKASRIRSIQEKGTQKVEDPIETEFVGIINYCIIALIQCRLEGKSMEINLTPEDVTQLYDHITEANIELLQQKNHDYSEAWRDMRISSITDIILMKLHRLKQIENNQGHTLVSEGIEANYRDILNYSVFALITGSEKGLL